MRTLINTEVIPSELKNRPQWVVWKYVIKNGERTKVPCDAKTGYFASVNKPHTWSTFREAVLMYTHRQEFAGIGFVMTGKEGIIGIDIDGRIDHDLINRFGSYSELTPSGNGCRIFIKADVTLTDKRKPGIEIYNNLRFFTVTGNALHQTGIEDREEEFKEFYNGIVGNQTQSKVEPKPVTTTKEKPTKTYIDIDDSELLHRIFTHDKYGDLHKMRYEGNIPQCDYREDSNKGLVPDPSKARFNFVRALSNWTNKDIDRIIRILRSSALYDSKLDEIRDGRPFIESDIERIINWERK